VLVATSLRASSALCPTFGAGLVKVTGGSLTLLHVLESSSDKATEDAEATEGAAAAMHRCKGRAYHAARRADHGSTCRILGGSAIHEVVCRATCPVFTIKPTEVANESKRARVSGRDGAIPHGPDHLIGLRRRHGNLQMPRAWAGDEHGNRKKHNHPSDREAQL
jgi:hypothetical protein